MNGLMFFIVRQAWLSGRFNNCIRESWGQVPKISSYKFYVMPFIDSTPLLADVVTLFHGPKFSFLLFATVI